MPKGVSDTNELSSRLHYKALVDNSMSAIFFSITDGTILEANQKASEIFGYSEGELKQVGRQGIIDHTDPGFQKLYAERKEHGRIKGELIGIKKSGERFPIEVYSSILKDDKGNEFSYTIINDISERKKSEREINLLMNNTDEAFLLFDKELKIISFNRKSQELFKEFLQVEIIKGASVLDYVQPEKKEMAADLYRRVLTGTSEKSIRKISLPDKSQKIFIFQHHPAKDEVNTIIGVFVTAIDITHEKELENKKEELLSQLQQRNSFIETVLEKLPIGLTVNRIDDGKATVRNKKFSEIYGWNEAELTDVETFFRKVYPDKQYREKIAGRIMADINSGDIDRMQWNNISITTQTGEKRVVNAKNIPLYEQNLMISTVMDVTRESVQAAEIKRTKFNLDALINGTIDLIWSVDKDLRIITVNSAYQNMMQTVISRRVKEGDPVIIEEFGEELCVKWKTYYTRALKGEQYTIREEVYNPVSEKMDYRMVSFHPMTDGAGNIFGVACYAKDVTEDILNLQLIERTQNKLKKVMDSSLDIICTVNSEGYYTQMSAASETILGYKPEELIGRRFSEFIYPEDLPQTERTIDHIMQGNNLTYVSNRYVHKTGRIVPMEWSARWDPKEQLRYAVGRDVTEKIKAQTGLIESEKKYKALFENNPSPMIVWDFETKQIIDCNEEALLKYGYTRPEFLSLSIKDIRPPEDIPLIEEATRNETAYGEIHKKVWRHQKKNGDLMMMDITGHLIEYNNRRAALVIANDITEKIKVEEELKRSEEKYRILFESSPLPKWIFDMETYRILEVNRAAINHYGYSREEFLSRTIQDMRPEEEMSREFEMHGDVKGQTDTIGFGTFTHRKKDQSKILAEVSGNQLTYLGRECMMVVCVDITEKAKAEEKLLLSETFLREAQRLAKLGSWNFGFKNNKLTWSDELYKVFGVNKDSFHETHDSFIVLVNEEDRELVKKTSKQTQETGDPFKIEYHITTPSGDKRIIEEYGYGEKDAAGNVIRLFGTAQDITERKQAEEKIKESNQRYNYVTKATSDAIWDWDLINQTIYWGEGFQDIFGYQLKDLPNDISSWTDHIHPEDIDRVSNGIYTFIEEGGTNWRDEFRYLKSNQKYAYVIDKGIVIRDESGKPIRMIGAMQDITKQKEEEHRQKLLESVITHTNDAVVITEAEPVSGSGPRIMYVNEAFTRMTGYAPEEVIGKTPRLLQGPKSDQKELERLKLSLQKWEACEITTINYKKNGEEFWINFTVSPVADANGWFTHWIAIERDITERKLEELQNEFLTAVSLLFNESLELNETLQKVLGKASRYIDFNAAEVWLVSADDNKINQMATYADSDQSVLFFSESQQIRTLSKGEGLSGAPWVAGNIMFLNNINRMENFIRRGAAEKAGFRSACGVPLIHNQNIIGGIMFWSRADQFEEQRLTVFFQKLSDHISSEILRKQLEGDLNRVFNLAPDVICVVGFDGYLKKINPVLPQMLEYTEQELLSKPLVDFIHPEDKDATKDELESLTGGKGTLVFENRYRTKSGKYIWIAWTATPMKEEELIFAVGKNVTERKALEALLQKASSLARMGAWEVDLVSQTISWSDITREIHEVAPDYTPDLETRTQFYKEGENSELIKRAVKEAIEKGTPWDLELQIITAKGNEKWVRAIGETEWADGKCIRLYGSLQDIDSIKKDEQLIAGTLKEKNNILESIGDGFFTVDKNWIITYWNATAETILGKQRNDILGKYFWDVYPDVIDTTFHKQFIQAIEEDKTKHFEAYYEGLSSWYEVSAYPTDNGLSVYFRDVTFTRAIQQNIRDSEEKRRLIMNSALDAIICIDTHGDITFWNPQAEAIFGWNENEVMGKQLSEIIIPEEYRKMHDNGLEHYLKTGEGPALNVLLNLTALKRTGETVFIELTVLPIKQGGTEFFCAFIRDITERKKSEAAIQRSNERYLLVSKATSDIIWDWNLLTNEISRSHENIEKLLGYKKEESQDTCFIWMNQVHPEDIERVKQKIAEVILDPEAHYYEDEYRFKKADNQYAYLHEKGYIIRDAAGKAIRIIGSTQDITKLKENEIQLKKRADELAISNLELEQFAFVASHDLQEPLRMVTSFLTQLENKYDAVLDDKGKKYIYFAVDGAKRMRQIILDLLEYSRVGRTESELEEIPIEEIVKEIKILLHKKIKERNAEIRMVSLPVIHSYRAPMRQVFQNLISNALKYSKEGVNVQIHITVEKLPNFWQFCITDNGIGIHSDYFDKVFVLFQRLHTKSEYSGTGMGLAVSKKIVENLGGKIWVTSEEGKGSSFYFTIPK